MSDIASTTEEAVSRNRDLQNALTEGQVPPAAGPEQQNARPVYKVVGETRIPVSAFHGPLWKSRRDQSIEQQSRYRQKEAWEEAIKYYQNDQLPHRHANYEDRSGNEQAKSKLGRGHAATENIVFANTSALVQNTYARNPTVEFTATTDASKDMAETLGHLINTIIGKRHAPGVDLKTKARKCVLMAHLTNCAYVDVGWTFRDQSQEAARDDLNRLSKAYAEARGVKQIEQVEGELEALEQSVDFLRPAGPYVDFADPRDVLMDSDGVLESGTDCKWVMVRKMVSTSWINAKFAVRGENEWKSIYRPTHVLDAKAQSGKSATQQEIDNYSLVTGDLPEEYKRHGYDDIYTYKRANRTLVWYVWDRITQRIFMYNDRDWSWPIWVWEDRYNLEGFFSLCGMHFYADPERRVAKAETTYYLDQQDELNDINSEMARARSWARRNFYYNSRVISGDQVSKLIKGDEDVAVGIEVPDGTTLEDHLKSFLPPSMQFIQLFEKGPILEAIDRVSSVTSVMRGSEFKTNTTNKAIEKYSSNENTRLDEKIDAVEDFIGGIAWKIAQLCVQYYSEQDVIEIIGAENTKDWVTMTRQEFTATYHMKLAGGSTIKPTAANKQRMALELGQVLGQFVNAAPRATIRVLLEVFSTAFDEVNVTQDMFDEISMEATGQPASRGSPGGEAAMQQDPLLIAAQVLDQLPQEARAAVGNLLAQGVPMQEVVRQLAQQQQPTDASPTVQ